MKTKLPGHAALAALALAMTLSCRPVSAGDPPATPLERPGLHRLFRLSDRVYSGGQPEGEPAFAALRQLGIRTLISVDGAAPDVEAARRHGLRYVHLPIGYDGIGAAEALKVAKAADALPGPVLVHCHHGKHRGPAAAALACRTTSGWSVEQALAWLEQAETSPAYAGLFRTVREFDPPDPRALARLPADFPERADVPPLVEAMVAIGEHAARLDELAANAYRPTQDHPDIDPPHEALLLVEQLSELTRATDAAAGAEFESERTTGLEAARRLEAALRDLERQRTPERLEAVRVAHRAVKESCTRCHAALRD